jgi:hypothetical protein
MPKGQHPRGKPISTALREAATALVQQLGSDKLAAQEIGIGRNTLARALAGLPVLNGNHHLLRQRFPEAVDASGVAELSKTRTKERT